MSRLDSFIRRMQAQRACLNWAGRAISDLPGPVLELGLGNGRTYDHLREILPNREIYVFERCVVAHPDCIPPRNRLFIGELTDTLPTAAAKLGQVAAMAHADLGTGVAEANAELANTIGPLLARLVAPGGIVISDQALAVPGWVSLPEPEDVMSGRYFLYRAT
ncbi:MAG: class I SAM-dependent methyltransferase [Arenicellales bacterium]|nr:class I SAM-dependent methyltransferase [Arenicellales bacterium]